jgi:hypothetical protein
VFVDNDVRLQLEEKKIDKAIVRCDIQLYRPLEKGTAPVITKRWRSQFIRDKISSIPACSDQ